MIEALPAQSRTEARGDREKLLRYPADDASSHEYEVKRVHMEGATFNAAVFYLRAGEPVSIDFEDVFRKTDLWTEPNETNPRMGHHLIFEVAPEDNGEPVDLYICRFDAELERSNS